MSAEIIEKQMEAGGKAVADIHDSYIIVLQTCVNRKRKRKK